MCNRATLCTTEMFDLIIWAATWQNQQNECAPSEDSDQTGRCAQWVAKDPSFLHADSEDSDQTGRMPRLIWVYAGRTLCWFCMSRLICIITKAKRNNTGDEQTTNVTASSRNTLSCIPDNVFRDFHPSWIFPSYTRVCKTTSCMTSGRRRCEPNRTFLEHFLIENVLTFAQNW